MCDLESLRFGRRSHVVVAAVACTATGRPRPDLGNRRPPGGPASYRELGLSRWWQHRLARRCRPECLSSARRQGRRGRRQLRGIASTGWLGPPAPPRINIHDGLRRFQDFFWKRCDVCPAPTSTPAEGPAGRAVSCCQGDYSPTTCPARRAMPLTVSLCPCGIDCSTAAAISDLAQRARHHRTTARRRHGTSIEVPSWCCE